MSHGSTIKVAMTLSKQQHLPVPQVRPPATETARRENVISEVLIQPSARCPTAVPAIWMLGVSGACGFIYNLEACCRWILQDSRHRNDPPPGQHRPHNVPPALLPRLKMATSSWLRLPRGDGLSFSSPSQYTGLTDVPDKQKVTKAMFSDFRGQVGALHFPLGNPLWDTRRQAVRPTRGTPGGAEVQPSGGHRPASLVRRFSEGVRSCRVSAETPTRAPSAKPCPSCGHASKSPTTVVLSC